MTFPNYQHLKVNPNGFCNKYIEVEHEKWRTLYLAKLKACYKIADFSDSKKDVEWKEQKKEILIEIIDILDDNAAGQLLLND